MTWVLDGPGGAAVIRGLHVETLANDEVTIRLLADADDTHGALSTQRVTLRGGVDGASPHRHQHSTEMFYVLDGSVDLLIGDEVTTAISGDLIVVPPDLPHAFAASKGHDADLLIVITPGIERFEYFRHLARIRSGAEPAESILDVQERYDNYFVDSSTWRVARS
jgi:quercetin dioxygenase-like cupin family protein